MTVDTTKLDRATEPRSTDRRPADEARLPAWIEWPVRAVALLVLVPLRLLLSGLGRLLAALEWCWQRAVVRPLRRLWLTLVVEPKVAGAAWRSAGDAVLRPAWGTAQRVLAALGFRA